MTAWQRLRQHPLICLWLPVVLWMGLIFFLSDQPDLPHPDSDWLGALTSIGAHMFVFGVLAMLWARALGERPRALLLALLLTMLYAAFDEFHQSFVPGRTADPFDILSDGAGAALGISAWALFQQLRARARRHLSGEPRQALSDGPQQGLPDDP
ncbi:VanZ family protein [Chloroflexota bacterium]